MRSYGQYCALAKALDLVGDRWTLLIVRELLTRGACRYTDLRAGLPDIATNLLVRRLRELEEAGIVVREDAPPPVASTLFSLTERGTGLVPALQELARWGAPLVAKRVKGDTFRSHWMALPLQWHLHDSRPEAPPAIIELRAGDEPLSLEVSGGAVRARFDRPAKPDLVITGAPEVVVGLLLGWHSVEAAESKGLKTAGDKEVLGRIARTRISPSNSLQELSNP